MATITINDLVGRVEDLEKCFKGKNKRDLQFPILKLEEGLMKQRVFNEGEAADGTKLGNYRSKSHAKKRRLRGRQTGYKDLEFEGDLRRSLTVGTNGGDVVLGFSTDKGRLIAAYQESDRQTGKEIWSPTDSEINQIKEVVVERIRACLKKNLGR